VEGETTTNSTNGATTPWYSSLPDNLTVEDGGKQIPLRDHQFIKETPDVATLAKRALDNHRALGGAVRLPGKDAKDEDRKAFLDKVYSTGLFPRAPESPDKYEIAKPEGIPWDDALEKEFRATAHSLGMSNDQVKAIMALDAKRTAAFHAQAAEVAKAQEAQYAANFDALKKDWGPDFEKNAELVARAGQYIFGTPEEAAKHGFTNDPKFLSKGMLKIAKMLEADDGFMQGGNSVSPVITEARKEIDRIRTDKTHPMHERYMKGDQTVAKHLEALYQQEHEEMKKAQAAA
jgi:hypothetical protein